MDDSKAQLAEKLKKANNILVTVSRNPSVDQLASCIGLTLLLNKQGKHAAAVFSGDIPSTLEFLQPEDTLEKNTDSLRDFIVSLDKAKADKLRYKVEDNVVRIFITPYRTSISEADLTFTQGDFNVEVVVALGVRLQEDLDEAITAHGRILHDATVATINIADGGELGTLNWTDPQASSLSELVTDLAKILGGNDLIDGQIATALLTGIVAETDRFSNDKTTSQTMNASAILMAAGANQQLVATKLAEDSGGSLIRREDASDDHVDHGDGLLEIKHSADDETPAEEPIQGESTPQDSFIDQHVSSPEPPLPDFGQPSDSDQTQDNQTPEPPFPSADTEPRITVTPGARMITEPPSLGSFLSPAEQGAADPLGLPIEEPPLLFNTEKADNTPSGAPPPPYTPPVVPSPPPPAPPPAPSPPAPDPVPWQPPEPPVTDDVASHTLAELEKSLGSPHADPANLDAARDEVSRALTGDGVNLPDEPVQALGAQPLGSELHPAVPVTPPPDSQPPLPPVDPPSPPPQVIDPSAPPPVPPPIPFQFGNPAPPQ